MFDAVVNLEIELHSPAVRRNITRLEELLHDEFIEIGRSGVIYDTQQISRSSDRFCQPNQFLYSHRTMSNTLSVVT